MNSVAQKPSRYDGLTRDQRATLYLPETFSVEQTGPIRFIATSIPTGAQFRVTVAYGRFFFVHSNTGNDHLVTLGCCDCKDYERGLAEGRRCKHSGACEAVENFIEAQANR